MSYVEQGIKKTTVEKFEKIFQVRGRRDKVKKRKESPNMVQEVLDVCRTCNNVSRTCETCTNV